MRTTIQLTNLSESSDGFVFLLIKSVYVEGVISYYSHTLNELLLVLESIKEVLNGRVFNSGLEPLHIEISREGLVQQTCYQS